MGASGEGSAFEIEVYGRWVGTESSPADNGEWGVYHSYNPFL